MLLQRNFRPARPRLAYRPVRGLPIRGLACPCPRCGCGCAEPLETLALEVPEWEGEVNRGSADYVRWFQAALNRIDGAGLVVDGISGSLTKAAVRGFQSRRGLAADGIVGPITEAALIAAGAGSPPDSVAAWPPAPSPPAGGRPVGSGRKFPTSSDGTPLFRQGDPEWADRILGANKSIAGAGCAITSLAMALSKIARRIYTPLDVDQWIDTHGGYDGDGIRDWNVTAQVAGLGAQRLYDMTLPTVDRELDRGRPVVIAVDKDFNGGNDHWIALTRRAREAGKPVYYANDPASGQVIRLTPLGSQLAGTSNNYRSTGSYTVITGG